MKVPIIFYYVAESFLADKTKAPDYKFTDPAITSLKEDLSTDTTFNPS
jgi:hypothetical protein